MSDATEQIGGQIKGNKVILYMKGNREMPQCGFSARVVQILDSYDIMYETVDVLADPEIRQGIKDYSNWPTIPQLYVDGEFIGGCDICVELFQSGELESIVKKA
ncbi:MAG: Grx4 family monothiol glutaredoxin [Deltaproteobacteria bacterium]|nr:Grx4 family monothiol glutaredoxin [Deltaproteobacteria bacterium]